MFSGWHSGVWQHDAGGGEGAPEEDEEVGEQNFRHRQQDVRCLGEGFISGRSR